MKITHIKIDKFGKLSDFCAEFGGGVNIIYGENGSGKTTLFTFIKACFYGLAKGKGAKERASFLPWDGGIMSGELGFTDDENRKRLIRVKFGTLPREDKNILIDDITGGELACPGGKTIGETVLGMSENTFCKTAYLRQSGTVFDNKSDDEIAQKLSNLQQSGDENISYTKAAATLETLQRTYAAKRGSGGSISKTEAEIETLKSRFGTARMANENNINRVVKIKDAKRRRDELKSEYQRLEAAQEMCEYKKINALKQERAAVSKELSSLGEDEVSGDDFKRAAFLSGSKKQAGNPSLFVIMCVLCAVCAVAGVVYPFLFIGLGLFVCFAVMFFPRKTKEGVEFEDILEKYTAADFDELVRKNERTAVRGGLKKQLELLDNQYKNAVSGKDIDALDKKYAGVDLGTAEFDVRELSRLSGEIISVTDSLARQEAELESAGGENTPEEIKMEIDNKLEKLDELNRKKDALSLAAAVLDEAYYELESEFGPKLNSVSGEILSRITNNKYHDMRMTKDYKVKLTERAHIEDIENFSAGTVDQAFLAYRLGMLKLIGGSVPLFLDEPFLQYDDGKSANTLEYLSSIPEQIILFTCKRTEFPGANYIEMNRK